MADDLEVYFEDESLEVEFVEDAPMTVQFVDGDTTEITFLEPEDLTVELVESEPLEVAFDGQLFITGISQTYETISKNLIGYPYVITYADDDIDYITYDLGGGLEVVKTFNYTLGVLTSLVLSGDTPLGISLTKILVYTGDDLTSVEYS